MIVFRWDTNKHQLTDLDQVDTNLPQATSHHLIAGAPNTSSRSAQRLKGSKLKKAEKKPLKILSDFSCCFSLLNLDAFRCILILK